MSLGIVRNYFELSGGGRCAVGCDAFYPYAFILWWAGGAEDGINKWVNKNFGGNKLGINKAQKVIDNGKYRWYKVYRRYIWLF